MCYKYARLVNEGLSLPSRSDYFRPPFTGMDVVPAPELPVRVVNNMVMAAPSLVTEFTEGLDLSVPLESVLSFTHPEPSFVNEVAIYGSRGRGYRRLAPTAPLPPREHSSGGSPPSPRPMPQVGRGRARLVTLQSWRDPGHSRN